jgi:hypothetical protein
MVQTQRSSDNGWLLVRFHIHADLVLSGLAMGLQDGVMEPLSMAGVEDASEVDASSS